jgi:hypothetical protein
MILTSAVPISRGLKARHDFVGDLFGGMGRMPAHQFFAHRLISSGILEQL